MPAVAIACKAAPQLGERRGGGGGEDGRALDAENLSGHFDALWDFSAGGEERDSAYRKMYPPVARAAINRLQERVGFCWPEGREYRYGRLGGYRPG